MPRPETRSSPASWPVQRLGLGRTHTIRPDCTHRSSLAPIWVDRPPWVDYPFRIDRANRLVTVCPCYHCYSAPTRPASAASPPDPIQSIRADRLVQSLPGPLISPRFHHADSVCRGPSLLPLSRRAQPINRPHSPNRLPSRVEDFVAPCRRLPFFGRHCRADSLLRHDPSGTDETRPRGRRFYTVSCQK